MPVCPECGTSYDDLWDVSVCLGNHRNGTADVEIMENTPAPPSVRVIEDPWLEFPEGKVTGTNSDIELLEQYTSHFLKVFGEMVRYNQNECSLQARQYNDWPEEFGTSPFTGNRIKVNFAPNRRNVGLFRHGQSTYSNHGGFYYCRNPHIEVSVGWTWRETVNTLCHEIVHYCQYVEADALSTPSCCTTPSLGKGWSKAHGDEFEHYMFYFNDIARRKNSPLRIDKKHWNGAKMSPERQDANHEIERRIGLRNTVLWSWGDRAGIGRVIRRSSHCVSLQKLEGDYHGSKVPWSSVVHVYAPWFTNNHEFDISHIEEEHHEKILKLHNEWMGE